MIRFSCLFAVVSCRLALDIPQDDFIAKIINGKSVLIEEYPYQLSLRYMDEPFCGASILTERYAITAAHCTHGYDIGLLSILYGVTSLDDEDGEIIKVKRVHQHPEFSMALLDYDLAILELAKDVVFSEKALPITIKVTHDSLSGKMGVVTGWGVKRNDVANMTNDLQAVEVPIMDHKRCQEIYQGLAPITPRTFCAGDLVGGKDSCRGDSGGPFAVNGELVGVVSWGWGCGESEYPGVYTNISTLIDFVEEIIQT